MPKKRPQGFVYCSEAVNVVENSINSVIEWGRKTQDAFGDTDEKVERLNELISLLVILKWRYGKDRVAFKFTNSKKIPDAIPIKEIVDSEEFARWGERIWLEEEAIITKVYINF